MQQIVAPVVTVKVRSASDALFSYPASRPMNDAAALPTLLALVAFAVLLGTVSGVVASGALRRIRAPIERPTPFAESDQRGLAAGIAADLDRRITSLEAQMPEWRLGMAKLADEAAALFDDTERKRRQVQATEARISKKRGEPEAPQQPAEDAPGATFETGAMLPFTLSGDRNLDKARLRQMRTGR